MIAGVLNDKGMNDSGVMFARINDHLMPVLPYVIPFLEKIEKGSAIEYNEKDGHITKIARAKVTGSIQSKAEIDKEREDYNAKAAKEAETAAMKAKLAYDEELLAVAKKAEQAAVLREPGIDEKLKKSGFNPPTGGNIEKRTSPIDSPENIERINRESEEHGKRLQAEIAARKAAQNPAPVTQLVPATQFSNDQINLIKATVARGCTDTEFELLMYLSAQYGLDPIRRQIWAVKYGSAPASIFTGRDGFLEIAHRSGQFDGMESGVKTVREGEKDELIGWCKVYRKDMSHAFYVEVYEREYTTGKNLWQTKPRIMIQKCAESSCLRRAFSVCGLYSPEEMGDIGGGS